ETLHDEGLPSLRRQSAGLSDGAGPLIQPRSISASRAACRPMWRGSGRRQSPNKRLVSQPADPHLWGLSMSGDTLHHEIRWNVEYVVGVSQAIPLGPRLGRARQAELLDRDRLTYALAAKRLDIRMRVQSAFATALYWQRVVQAREE